MSSVDVPSAPTISDIKRDCRPSWRSAAVIIPLATAGFLLGGWRLGFLGGIGVGLAGFLLGVFLEMNLISWRLGISRNLMLVCSGLNLRGDVEKHANKILFAYCLLRKKRGAGPQFLLNLDRLADDLLKALNALSHYPAIEGFHQWQDRFSPLVDATMALATRPDQAGGDFGAEILKLRQQARDYFGSILEHITVRRALR